MATRPKLSEAATLELYRVSLENVEKQSEITSIMAEYGYNTDFIAEGKILLTDTREAYNLNKTEDDETSEVYYNYASKKQELSDTYALDRKKAKVVFLNDHVTANKLSITGMIPQAYIKWLEKVKKFYSVTTSDADIQTKLSRLKFTPEDLANANSLIADVETTRSEYLKEKGESQAATKSKDNSFVKLDAWMREFYMVAKIALDDKPQLLESLGKFVSSK